MNRTPVNSSNVLSIGYDNGTATLEVEFSSGSVYEYFDVPQSVYEQLMASASVGSALNDLVKGNFRYARI